MYYWAKFHMKYEYTVHTLSFSGQQSGLHSNKTGLFYWKTNTVQWWLWSLLNCDSAILSSSVLVFQLKRSNFRQKKIYSCFFTLSHSKELPTLWSECHGKYQVPEYYYELKNLALGISTEGFVVFCSFFSCSLIVFHRGRKQKSVGRQQKSSRADKQHCFPKG